MVTSELPGRPDGKILLQYRYTIATIEHTRQYSQMYWIPDRRNDARHPLRVQRIDIRTSILQMR